MSVRVTDVETPEHVVLVWSAEADDSLTNHSGVGTPHVTRIEQGAFLLEIAGEEPRRMGPGEEVILPVKTVYTFTALTGPAMIRCFYPKDMPGAVEEIEHLRTYDGSPRRMTS